MRFLTYSESLFGASLVFLFCYLAAFNYELGGREAACSIDLVASTEGTCVVNSEGSSDFRLIAHFGGDKNTVNTRIPLSIRISSKNYDHSERGTIQKLASTGAGKRYYSFLNYGVFKLPVSKSIKVHFQAGEEVEKLQLFEARIILNPRNIYVYTFAFLFLALLLVSIYSRKKTFIKRYGKPIPYVLFVFVAMWTLTWNV